MARPINVHLKVKDGFSTKMKKFNTALKRNGARFRVWARRASGAVAVVFASLVKGIVQFDKFERGMARVEALSGGGLDQRLRDDVANLSMEFGIASEEIINGFYAAISAGVPRGNLFEFMHVAAKVATVDGSNIETAVSGMASTMNAFGLQASKAEMIADTMFTTVQFGVTTFEELSSKFATAAPLAANLGINFEELLGAVAAITKQGTPTAEAMTQVRAAILSTNEILPKGWTEAMSLSEAFQEVANQADESGGSLRDYVGRVEAMNGIMQLTGNNLDKTNETMGKFTGSAGKIAETFKGTTTEAIKFSKVIQTLDKIMVSLGAIIKKALPLDWLQKNLSSSTAILQRFQKSSTMRQIVAHEMSIKMLKVQKSLFILSYQRDLVGKKIEEREKRLAELYKREARGVVADRDDRAAEKAAESAKVIAEQKRILEEEIAAQKLATEQQYLATQLAGGETAAAAQIEAQKKATDARLANDKKANEQIAHDHKQQNAKDLAMAKTRIEQEKKLKDAALGLNRKEGFAERFQAFQDRRKQAEDSAKEDAKIANREAKILEKQKRGIKVTASDKKFLKNIEAFKKAEEKAEKHQKRIIELTELQNALMADVLMAAPQGALN